MIFLVCIWSIAITSAAAGPGWGLIVTGAWTALHFVGLSWISGRVRTERRHNP